MQNQQESKAEISPAGLVSRLAMVLIIGALLFLVRVPLSWTDQTLLSAALIGCCILLGRLSDSRFVTSTLLMVSVFSTCRYIVWRWTSSISFLNNSGWRVDVIGLSFALLLLCAESYSVFILLLGYLQSARPLKRLPAPMPMDTDTWPSVDVFIPTYNEPLEVVRPTVLAAMGIDWPPDRLKVYILDDGRREQFRDFARECGVAYLTRDDNRHAKAGNINAALKKTDSEFVAIFDCDHVATRSFLQLTMGWFAVDERLAMVQTPHHFYSPDPFERNLNVFRTIPNEGALFYGVVQDGNDLWNATFFCGSCAVIKREALEEVGGIAVETVTEDAHTALRLQRRGWNTAYIGIPQAAGLATGSLAAHVGQRIRWARGMVQILRTEFPLFAGGLKLPQRLCYLNCAVHYLYAIPRLIFVSAPLVYLLLGKSNLYGYIWEILAYAAPHLVLSNMVNSRCQGDHRHSFWNEVYEMVLAPYILLPTTFALINPKWGKFNVTPKSSVVDENYFDWKIARPYIILIALNLIAIIAAVPRYFTSQDPSGVLVVNVIWAILNTLLLGACVAVSFETRQRRSAVRVETLLTASLQLGSGELHHCRVLDLSEGGLALRSDRALECVPGQPAQVAIRAGDEEFRFRTETVRTSENRIHLRFSENHLNHHRDVTRIVYARADSWLDWGKDQRRDRILSSLVNVFGIGAKGIWMLPSLLIRRQAKSKPRTRKSPLAKPALPALILGLLSGAVVFSSRAQTPVIAEQGPTAGHLSQSNDEFRDSQSFSDLGRKSAIVLGSDKSKDSMNLVIPSTKIVGSAELSVHFVPGEITSNSDLDLDVRLNDVEVAHVAVPHGSAVPSNARLPLPADLLVHDNVLTFEVKRQCSKPCPPDPGNSFWLRVEPYSRLETGGLVLSLPNRLSMLPSPFFDPSIHRALDVPVVFETQPDLSELRAAGVLASWYGALAGYRGSRFTTSVGQLPKGNLILLAKPGGPLAGLLGLNQRDDSKAAQVAICDNPADRYGKVLALVADSGETIVRLAQYVARNRFTEDVDRLSVSPENLADAPDSPKAPSWFAADKPLQILEQADDYAIASKVGSPASLYFRIAPDLDFGTNVTVPLHLAFRLSGLSVEDHVWLGIRLNNTFVTKRRLGFADCNLTQTQSFAIPASLLYASNTLEIELSVDRQEAFISDPSAVSLQILTGTTLDLKNPAHQVRMPRLDLFAAAGYPFTSTLDGSQTAVVVPEYASSAQIGMFLDALGFLGAQTGQPATAFQVVNPKNLTDVEDRNILVVGSATDESPFRRFERSLVVIPGDGRLELSSATPSWTAWFSRDWLGRKEEMKSVSSLLEHDFASRFVMEEAPSPFRSDRSVVAIITRSDTDEQPYLERMSEASRRGAVSGGLTIADDKSFVSFNLDLRSWALGVSSPVASAYSWLRYHLWFIPLLVMVAAMFLAHCWESLLEQQAKKRLNPGRHYEMRLLKASL